MWHLLSVVSCNHRPRNRRRGEGENGTGGHKSSHQRATERLTNIVPRRKEGRHELCLLYIVDESFLVVPRAPYDDGYGSGHDCTRRIIRNSLQAYRRHSLGIGMNVNLAGTHTHTHTYAEISRTPLDLHAGVRHDDQRDFEFSRTHLSSSLHPYASQPDTHLYSSPLDQC